jgi:flagellar assembly factor FliW
VTSATRPADQEPETEVAVLQFDAGLPGFPEARSFVVEEIAPESAFSILRCLDADVEFVVTSPSLFFPEYAPDIDDATVEKIGLAEPTDALLLIIVNVGETLADTTANLMGPIVVNLKSLKSVQAVLSTGDFSVKTPLGLS